MREKEPSWWSVVRAVLILLMLSRAAAIVYQHGVKNPSHDSALKDFPKFEQFDLKLPSLSNTGDRSNFDKFLPTPK